MYDFKTTIECPVCKKRFLKHALSKHVSQKAQREVYQHFKKHGFITKFTKLPHEDFRNRNLINKKVLKI